MNNLYFWNNWTKSYKYLYSSFLIALISIVLFFIYSEYSAKNIGLKWDVISEAKTTNVLVDTFQKGFFEFGVDVENHYYYQSFAGTIDNSMPWFAYLIVGAISILMIGGSVTISYTKGLWYLVAQTFLGAFFFLLNLDVLEVFGLANMYWTIIVFLAFGFSIHYFHAFQPFTPLAYRYVFFTFLTSVFLFLTLSFSKLNEPIHFLASYGILAPIMMAFIYIIIISTDILSGFLFLTTDSRNANKWSSLLNFILVSLFFLGNIALTFMKNRGSLDWNILYLEAPIILLIASGLGIWAHKKKEPVYQFMADFSPATAVWFLILAINCFVCYSFANFSGNDPLQEVLEDSIIFGQLAFGTVFILFVVANFMGLMEQNLPVHMVIYKPRYMPFGFVRLLGLIGVTAIVMYGNQYQMRQLQAGYYIGIAEAYLKQDDKLLGEEYLRNALSNDEGNHKANYMLGLLAHEKDHEDPIAKVLLKQAMFKNPSPQDYATLGYYFLQDGDIIRSLETLREGKTKFPKSPEILNNLAMAFSKTKIQDSTIYYFQQASKYSEGSFVATSNQLAFALQNNIKPEFDTINIPKDLIYRTNLLALMNKSGKFSPAFETPDFINDTAISDKQASYLLNLSFNNLKDTINFKTYWLDSLIKKPANTLYSEELLLNKAYREYYSGNVSDGIVTLDQLRGTGSNPIKYNNTLSNWLIQQDAPRVSYDFLDNAKIAGDRTTAFGIAIATSFYLSGADALSYWQDPVLQTDATFKSIVNSLSTKQANIYTIGILPQLFAKPDELVKAFNTQPSTNDKNKALGRLMQHLIDIDQAYLAIELYGANPKTEETNWQYLRALRKTNQRELAAKTLESQPTKPVAKYIEAWASNDEKKTEMLYKQALRTNPIYEEGVIDAIQFLETKQKDEATYDLLLQSVMMNQYSIPLQKAYTLQCVKLNLFGSTDFGLAKLKDLMSKSDYTAFASEVKRKQEERVNNMEWK